MPPRQRPTTQLRAVTPGEAPAPAKPRTRTKRATSPVADAADTGSRRDLLAAQRTRLAKAVDSPDTRPRELAQLSRQLLLIDEEIRQIDARASEAAEGEEMAGPTDDAWDSEAI